MSKLLGIAASIVLGLSVFTMADAKVDTNKYAYASTTVVVTPVAHGHYYRYHSPYWYRHHGYYQRHNHWYRRW